MKDLWNGVYVWGWGEYRIIFKTIYGGAGEGSLKANILCTDVNALWVPVYNK